MKKVLYCSSVSSRAASYLRLVKIIVLLNVQHIAAFRSTPLGPQRRQFTLSPWLWGRTKTCSSIKRCVFIRILMDKKKIQRSTTILKASDHRFEPQSQSPIGAKQRSPTPVMPSLLFQELALSQLELLASSVLADTSVDFRINGESSTVTSSTVCGAIASKIKSMAVYLPQENSLTGQLEFLPAVLYPHPKKERVFIANDSGSGMAPEIPTLLTKLPGFAHATSLLPGYPMVSMPGHPNNAGVGEVEEVLCDVKSGGTALSVPLFSGSLTVGVLLVSPDPSKYKRPSRGSIWTEYDRQQVARAAKSISLALSMDAERTNERLQNLQVRTALSDSLHQFKNPLQALRTYGKLLQRRMAESREMTPQALELADHLMAQSDRLVDRLKPVDAIVDAMMIDNEPRKRPFALMPVEENALVPWKTSPREPNLRPTSRWASQPATNWSTGRDGTTMWSQSPLNDELQFTDQALTPSPQQTTALFGEVKLAMAFVTDVLDPVFTAFHAIAAERDIDFDVEENDELPGVIIWPLALQEVIINLLDNAFKYVSLSEHRPTVRVRLLPNNSQLQRKRHIRETQTSSTEKETFPGVTILIEDNGPGIPQKDWEKVFERGYRSGSTSHDTKGSGIGLAIARELVQQIGGTLRVVETNLYPDSLCGAALELIVFRNPRNYGK